MNFVTANYLLDGYGVHTMSKKAKARVDARPALIEEAQDGIITCRLCEQKRSWNSGGFTRHLRSVHELTSGAYYLQCFGADWCLCLCGCGQQTAWEPREGYYKGYLTGHNYRGKTKENDPSVALRANKMVHNDEWKASCFKKGQEPWNKCSTDLEYLKKLLSKPKIKLTTSGIKKGTYNSSKTGVTYHYDSGWELERMQYYDNDQTINTWARCQDLVSYVDVLGQKRHYNPDFIVVYATGQSVVEEIKGGRFGLSVYNKMEAALKYYSLRGIQYNVLTKRHNSFISVPIELFNIKED